MKVLSLFDGISCGRVALERAGIKVSRYVAVEIDGHAQIISRNNHKDIQYFNDVCNVDFEEGEFDLILAGSPCQGFSKAGFRNAFEDERSKLYFEFLRIKNKVKPKYWLLENVRMEERYKQHISRDLWQNCVEINSRLLSAQNRERLYWTNIPFEMPEDKGIRLKHIVGDYSGIWVWPRGTNPGGIQHYNGVAPCITTSMWEYNFKLALLDGSIRQFTIAEMEQLQTLPIGYTSGIPKTKRTKAIGNAWTVDVIAHILAELKNV